MRDVHAMAGIVMCVPLIVPLVFAACCVAALAAPLVVLWSAWGAYHRAPVRAKGSRAMVAV
jgi:hypothetical protein